MKFWTIAKRYVRTKHATNTIKAIKNSSSPFAAQPKKLLDGSLFVRVNEFKRKSSDSCKLPPLLPIQSGRPLTDEEIEKAKELHFSDAEHWTIGRLMKKFNAPYGVIYDRVLLPETRALIDHEDEKRIISLSLHRLKGLMLREKIRLMRQQSF